MRFASLGSGSAGNALLVESVSGGRTRRLLVDCGFGPQELGKRLARLEVSVEQIDAVLVTHEHGDHIGGVASMARRHGTAVYLTWGTLTALPSDAFRSAKTHLVDPTAHFEVADFAVEPIAVPHDAREPVQYVIDDGKHRLGILTDLGHGTPYVVRALSGLNALVLECNHDEELLAKGPYTAKLKQRIAGPYGHLSNLAAAQILSAIDVSRLNQVVAAHLSERNNRADLAVAALRACGRVAPETIAVADQEGGFGWREV